MPVVQPTRFLWFVRFDAPGIFRRYEYESESESLLMILTLMCLHGVSKITDSDLNTKNRIAMQWEDSDGDSCLVVATREQVRQE